MQVLRRNLLLGVVLHLRRLLGGIHLAGHDHDPGVVPGGAPPAEARHV